MKKEENKGSDYVAYEYLTVQVQKDLEPLYIDCYENLGWDTVQKPIKKAKSNIQGNNMLVNLSFKRDRKIKNRSMLISLQKKCETALNKIYRLEKSKDIPSVIVALFLGVSGFAFLIMAFLLFKYHQITNGVLSIGIGILLCTPANYAYKKLRIKKELQVAPLIEEQYDLVYASCEQANILLG